MTSAGLQPIFHLVWDLGRGKSGLLSEAFGGQRFGLPKLCLHMDLNYVDKFRLDGNVQKLGSYLATKHFYTPTTFHNHIFARGVHVIHGCVSVARTKGST
jgi:hypothetical protein